MRLDTKCKYCKADSRYSFCSRECKISYRTTIDNHLYEIFSNLYSDKEQLIMNHIYSPNPGKVECSICSFDFFAHTNSATCQKCGTKSTCDVITVNDEKILVCPDCVKNIAIETIQPEQVQASIDLEEIRAKNFIQPDYSINYKQELYNAKVQSIEELRKSCKDDDEFIQKMVARYVDLTRIIKEDKVEQLALAQRIRDFGTKVREELREQIRKSDMSYVPAPPKIKVAKAEKVSPLERIVQAVAIAKGITIEQARAEVLKNSELVNSSKPSK